MTKLIADLRDLMTNHLLMEIPADPTGELNSKTLNELLLIFGNWRARFVPANARTVHRSPELIANPKSSTHQLALAHLEHQIQTGSDVTPHLSRGVKNAYEPTASRGAKLQRRPDLDLLIADWGIHHLHLSTSIEADGFVGRTDDLLFAAFTPTDAYLIDIYAHGAWTEIELMRVVADHWPNAGIIQPAVSLVGLADQVSPDERRQMRNAGVAQLLGINNTVWMPQSQTTAGTPLVVTTHVNLVMHQLDYVTNRFAQDEQWLDSEPDIAVSNPAWQPLIHEGQFGVVDSSTGVFVPFGTLCHS
jgi:hypothetical protein